jgi:dTDP-4-dehydrorhamnose 3,5-epimerase
MEIEHLPLAGALMLTPRVFSDQRGFFKESYSFDRYRQCGIEETFVQDNLSLSRRNVLRGLHGDARLAKLVEVLRGRIFDAIVDIRVQSPTYRRWWGGGPVAFFMAFWHSTTKPSWLTSRALHTTRRKKFQLRGTTPI